MINDKIPNRKAFEIRVDADAAQKRRMIAVGKTDKKLLGAVKEFSSELNNILFYTPDKKLKEFFLEKIMEFSEASFEGKRVGITRHRQHDYYNNVKDKMQKCLELCSKMTLESENQIEHTTELRKKYMEFIDIFNDVFKFKTKTASRS